MRSKEDLQLIIAPKKSVWVGREQRCLLQLVGKTSIRLHDHRRSACLQRLIAALSTFKKRIGSSSSTTQKNEIQLTSCWIAYAWSVIRNPTSLLQLLDGIYARHFSPSVSVRYLLLQTRTSCGQHTDYTRTVVSMSRLGRSRTYRACFHLAAIIKTEKNSIDYRIPTLGRHQNMRFDK